MDSEMTNQIRYSGKLFVSILVFTAFLLTGIIFVMPGGPAAYGELTQEQTTPPPPGMAKATFAAGCFWSMEAIFKQLKGVSSVFPGYSGGTVAHPSYDLVETGTTGYAETINITYNPSVISYAELVRILLTVRNPTTVNQQGPDFGSQYRSIIFYRNKTEKATAEQIIRQIGAEHIWPGRIVTDVQPFSTFYRAEAYHLNYYDLHPDQPYCAQVIAPEIAYFHQKFGPLIK
jgi:peptide-methionine (S)-S-oxide reductase